MNFWNAFTMILKKTAGAWFNPKGITLYVNEPNSVTKVVLSWSSFYIGYITVTREPISKRVA